MSTDITNQINKIINKTLENKIDWKVLNPSIFRWTAVNNNGQSFMVNFQVASPSNLPVNHPAYRQNENYVFTLQGLNPSEVILQLQVSVNSNSNYLELMRTLHKVILEKTQKDSGQILDNLLDIL